MHDKLVETTKSKKYTAEFLQNYFFILKKRLSFVKKIPL